VGIVSVGTKAELTNGRKTKGYANARAPSVVFAISPGIIANHVSARVNITSIAIITTHSNIPAFERNPIMYATKMIITIDIVLETSEVNTCAHNIDERDKGME
jgi:hypothetical protein